MYCNHCGAKNDDDAVFCESCGKRMKEPQAAPAPPKLQPESKSPDRQNVPGKLLYHGKARFGPYFIGVAIGIFFIIIAVISAFMFKDVQAMIVSTSFCGVLGLFCLFLGIRLAAMGSSMYIDIYEDHIEGRCWCEKHGEDFSFSLKDIVSVEHPEKMDLVSFVAKGKVYSIFFDTMNETVRVYDILRKAVSKRS